LIVGRKSGHWGVEEQSAVGAIARRMAEALDAATQAQQAAAGHDGPSGALAAQATALNRLTHLVEGVGQRMERIERELDTESSTIGRRAGDEDIDRTTEETVRASGAAPSDSATGNTPADASAGAVDDVLDTESYEARETTVAAAPDEMVDDDVADGWGRAAARDVALPAGEAPSPGGSEHTPDTALVEAQEEQQEGHGTDEHWSAAAHLSARVPRYERALERLPWAVVVVDALGNVAFANEASANLLRRDDVAPGMPFASALPAPERIASALAQLRSAAEADGEGGPDSSIGGAGDEQLEAGRSGGAPPGHASHCDIEVRFEDPDVRVELEPLTEPGAGYIGAVAVIHPAAAKPAGEGSKLVPELTDALRAPMSSILGYSDLLTSGSGVPEEQLGRFLHRIDANLARMQVMLGNLLTVIEIDDEDIRSEPVDVQQVVETAVGRARAQFEEKGLGVRCDLAEQLPPALAEPEALQQIVDNLLVNAAIRSPQGGDVTVGAEIRAAGDAESIVISVHDRGVSVTGAGSGAVEIDGSDSAPVALRIVRLLAARQGGGAWVESDRHGARFYVRLPVREAA
ncbi:MAG: ATP-binding protein, partial [Anaerolineae bacterium]